MSFPRQQFLSNVAAECARLGRHDVATWITVAIQNFLRGDDGAGDSWLEAARAADVRAGTVSVLECDENGEIVGVSATVEAAA